LFGENDDNQKPKLISKPLCKKSHIYTHKDDELENSNQSIQTITYTMSEWTVIVKKYESWNKKNSSSKDNVIKLVLKNIINKSVTNQFISCMVVIPIYLFAWIILIYSFDVVYQICKPLKTTSKEEKKDLTYWLCCDVMKSFPLLYLKLNFSLPSKKKMNFFLLFWTKMDFILTLLHVKVCFIK